MNLLPTFQLAGRGLYSVAKEVPIVTYRAFSNTAQGCFENPKAIPVLLASVTMATGGFTAAYKCGKEAVNSFKNRESVKGVLYTGGALVAGTTSVIGGLSTMVLASRSSWKDHDFNLIKKVAEPVLRFGVDLSIHVLEIPQISYEASKDFVDLAIKNPDIGVSLIVSTGLSTACAVTSYHCANNAIQAFKAKDYSKSGMHAVAAGITGIATAAICNILFP